MSGQRELPASQSFKSLLAALDSPERLQEIFSEFSAAGAPAQESLNGQDEGHDEAKLASRALEHKLLLSGQLGLALLERKQELAEDNKALLIKQRELEASISQLLDRLASAYRENAQVIKRAERAQANLDVSEASNRQLLITLEDNRKAFRRLSNSTAKANRQPSSSELNTVQQELDRERQRADTAEARARRSSMRASECESRLASISRQIDRSRLEHAEPVKPHFDTRTQSQPMSQRLCTTGIDGISELATTVDSLRSENDALRRDMQHLHDLLNTSQDQVATLQADQYDRSAFSPREETLQRLTGRFGSLRPLQYSPDPEVPLSPTPSDWATGSAGFRPLPHSMEYHFPSTSTSTSGGRRYNPKRQSLRLAAAPNIRRTGDRRMSVDLNTFTTSVRSDQTDLDAPPLSAWNRPTSPNMNGRASSPGNLKALTLGSSIGSLSSLNGSPFLPPPQEDSRESEATAVSPEYPTILEISPSPLKQLHHSEMGIGHPSTNPNRIIGEAVCTSDKSTQTESRGVTTLARNYQRQAEARPPTSIYPTSVLSSDAVSEQEVPARAPRDNVTHISDRRTRTGCLGVLVEQVTRLTLRVRTADLHSLEQRLKKQNLPGDVGHLAKTTMRDLLNEVENLRNHFRQVLDQESVLHTGETDATYDDTMSRKDFVALVKLFRDVLFDTCRLRIILNRLQLEPGLLSKLRDFETLQTPSELLNYSPYPLSDKSPAAALLAPLSRFIYGNDSQTSQAATKSALAKSKAASSRLAPKLGASSAIASATVNVEFGGPGGIRRQVSIMPKGTDGGLAGRYRSGIGRVSGSGGPGDRLNVSGIFAGGATMRSSSATSSALPTPGRVHASAMYNRQDSGRYASASVEAMLDPRSKGDEDDSHPSLLEKTLRPRGLSDSSIHSTFLSHANPTSRLLTPAASALSADATLGSSPADLLDALPTEAPRSPKIMASAGKELRKVSGSHRRQVASPPPSPSPSMSLQSPGLSSSASAPRPFGESMDSAPSKASSGTAGLFASIGTWASRAGDMASSYHESGSASWTQHRSTSGQSRRPYVT